MEKAELFESSKDQIRKNDLVLFDDYEFALILEVNYQIEGYPQGTALCLFGDLQITEICIEYLKKI